MKTYREMIAWLLEHQHHEVARSIVIGSAGVRSSEAHPDPIEAGARVHERVGMTIMMDCVSDYIHNHADGRQSDAMVASLFDAWLRMDCPGLVDPVVVERLREHNLFDRYIEFCEGSRNTQTQAEQVEAQQPPLAALLSTSPVI